jgi:MSHA biogenesis protein MshG
MSLISVNRNMAEYIYRGRDDNGQVVEGTAQAASRTDLMRQLRRQNIIATKIEQSSEQRNKQNSQAGMSFFNRSKIKIDDLIMFSRQMYALTRAGIPLIRAISGLADATRSPVLSDVLHDVTRSLTNGMTLSTAFRAHPTVFNELFISMIRMGESTGQLETAFKQLIDHLELEKDTRRKIVAATRYPIIVIVFISLAVFFVNIFVIPRFFDLFTKLGADLPLPTKILIMTSKFMISYWWLLLMIIAGSIYAFIHWKRTPEGHLQWDRFILKIPIIGGVFERVALGRFARPFAMMISAGVPLLQALTVTSRTVGNLHIGKGIESMLYGIERGESLLATASATGLFNSLILQMIAVGEETGNISELLVDIADFYDQEVEYDLKRLAESIEPLLLIVMGVLVLVLALGVFLPMWELGAAYQ